MGINFTDAVALLRLLSVNSQETLLRRAEYVHERAKEGKLSAGTITILANSLTWKQIADETLALLDTYEATHEADEQAAQATLLAAFRYKATEAAFQNDAVRAERWLNNMNLFHGDKTPYEADWI